MGRWRGEFTILDLRFTKGWEQSGDDRETPTPASGRAREPREKGEFEQKHAKGAKGDGEV